MKLNTTYLIATLLFGLCLLENDLRKKATQSEINPKITSGPSHVTSELVVNESIVIKPDFTDQHTLISDRVPAGISAQFVMSGSIQRLKEY
jgi:hypothetical protein